MLCGNFLALQQRLDRMDEPAAHCVIILPAGRQMRDMVLRLHDAVEAGDDAVLRHADMMLLQIAMIHIILLKNMELYLQIKKQVKDQILDV